LELFPSFTDPEAMMTTDAFMLDWSLHQGYANPSWCLIHRCAISMGSVNHSLLEDSILISNTFRTPGGLPSYSTNADGSW